MKIGKFIDTTNKLFSIVRKGQLIVKDTEKVKKILTDRQVQKTDTERLLGPIKKSRNRFKKVEGI